MFWAVWQKIKVAHFRLCHSRKSFVAYPEPQEMVLDAFVRALAFYGGVPRRVIIDNQNGMVTYAQKRVYHPRFLALMNHYVMEPVACTPASLGERADPGPAYPLFTPKILIWTECLANELGIRAHPSKRPND